MTEAQIKHMVDRFLIWKLPEHFNPDGGISFERIANVATSWERVREPVGTNLLDATQADAMVRHMLEGLPPTDADQSSIARIVSARMAGGEGVVGRLRKAAREVLAVQELRDIACKGSDAPAEHALGLLLEAVFPNEEMITIDGQQYRKFIRYPEEVDDGTLRCIRCGQIDEDEFHDDDLCRAALSTATPPVSAREAPAPTEHMMGSDSFNPAHGSKTTADQMAAVMLLTGTDAQKREALGLPADHVMGTEAGRLRDSTQAMASFANVDIKLWDRHSNACLDAATAIDLLTADNVRLRGILQKIAETEPDSEGYHRPTMSGYDAMYAASAALSAEVEG